MLQCVQVMFLLNSCHPDTSWDVPFFGIGALVLWSNIWLLVYIPILLKYLRECFSKEVHRREKSFESSHILKRSDCSFTQTQIKFTLHSWNILTTSSDFCIILSLITLYHSLAMYYNCVIISCIWTLSFPLLRVVKFYESVKNLLQCFIENLFIWLLIIPNTKKVFSLSFC